MKCTMFRPFWRYKRDKVGFSMGTRIFLLIILASWVCGVGCNMINPAEKVPTYVSIDSFQFSNPNPSATGSASHNITSAWVYYKNSLVGVFDLPAKVPVITDGQGQILVVPGITFSGLKNYQQQYPFYTSDTITITPAEGKVLPLSPKTQYRNSAIVKWMENFDLSNPFIPVDEDNPYDTTIKKIDKSVDPDKIFEGSGSGYIYLTKDKPSSESINNTGFPITKGEAYLELNCKSSVDFQVGLQTNAANGDIVYDYVLTIKATDTWKKLYVGLHAFVGQYNGKAYRVMVKAVLPDDQQNGYVLLDNLKVVSF